MLDQLEEIKQLLSERKINDAFKKTKQANAIIEKNPKKISTDIKLSIIIRMAFIYQTQGNLDEAHSFYF